MERNEVHPRASTAELIRRIEAEGRRAAVATSNRGIRIRDDDYAEKDCSPADGRDDVRGRPSPPLSAARCSMTSAGSSAARCALTGAQTPPRDVIDDLIGNFVTDMKKAGKPGPFSRVRKRA